MESTKEPRSSTGWPSGPERRGNVGDSDDARLVAGLRCGSETAFTTLVRRHQAPMLRVARAYVSSSASAEDVVQETWMAVLRGVDNFDGRSSLKTWMYRILTNRAKTTGQREGRCVPDAAFAEGEVDGCGPAVPAERFLGGGRPETPRRWRRPPLPWERAVEDDVVRKEALAIVRDAIDQLPPSQRLVITLRDVECWTPEEVCTLLDLSPTNQRVLLHRARSKVRQRLEGQHGTTAG